MKLISYGLIVSCICVAQSAFADKRVVVHQRTAVPQLGQGYWDKKDDFSGLCLAGRMVQRGTPVSSFDFTVSADNSSLAKELGFELGGRAQIGPTEVSLAAKFFNSNATNSHSISAVYSGSYSFEQEYLDRGSIELTPIGAARIKRDHHGGMRIRNYDEWREQCGDMYVASIEFEAKLFFSIRIEFASEEEKSASDIQAKLKSTFFSAQTHLQQSSSSLSKKSKVTISALQLGGDVSRITEIFAGNSENDDTKKGTYGFIECSMGDFGRCKEVLENAAQYAHEFSKQTREPNKRAIVAVHLQPYEHAGIFKDITTREEQQNFKEDQLTVGQLFDQNYKYSLETKRLLLGKPLMRLSPRQRELVGQIDGDLRANLVSLVNASKLCFDSPEVCTEAVSVLKSNMDDTLFSSLVSLVSYFNPLKLGTWYYGEDEATKNLKQMKAQLRQMVTASNVQPLKVIDPEKLIILPETFAQYCDLGLESKFESASLKQTIRSILALIPEQGLIALDELKTQPDKCLVAEQILNGAKKIDFAKKTDLSNPLFSGDQDEQDHEGEAEKLEETLIGDLRPIAVLSHLEELILDGHSLTNVSLLGKLKNLKSLSLKSNQIESVDGLEILENLESLDLTSNKLKDVSVLSGLDKLNNLILVNNIKGIICPFADEHRCEIRDFKNKMRFLSIGQSKTKYRYTARSVVAALPNNRVLMAGGSREHFECYDVELNSCTLVDIPKGKTPNPHLAGWGGSMTTLSDGRVFMSGIKSDGADEFKGGMLFEPDSNRFLEIPFKSHFQYIPKSTTLLRDGRVLMVGGVESWGVEIFDPNIFDQAQGVSPFIMVGRLTLPRFLGTSTLLQDGKVLLLGGSHELGGDRDTTSNSAEIYDPSDSSLAVVSDVMSHSRLGHTATLLPSGKVLITGGLEVSIDQNNNKNEVVLDSAELFDPSTGTFSELPSKMTSVRGFHTATLLENPNYVLITGPGDSAEIYDVVREKFFPIQCKMKNPRMYHEAIPLTKCRVLLVGGVLVEDKLNENTFELFHYILD